MVTVALKAITSRVWSSIASTLPNSTCKRSMLVPRIETMVTPTASDHQVECRQRGVFLQFGDARHEAGQDRNREAGDQAAEGHREQIETRQQEADGRAGQDRVRHRVADKAHPAQHQEHADRRAAERQREHAGERAAPEFELDEGGPISVSYSMRVTPPAAVSRRRRRRCRRTPRTCAALPAGCPRSAPAPWRPTPPACAPAAAFRGNSP